MPRSPRKKSAIGIYHIIMRGINRQDIFMDDHDYNKFISTLLKYKKICEFDLYAYCLMTNHIHLLIKVQNEPIETIMRRLCGSFVKWYNKKYNRIGYLFQDRYKSEPIDNESYFLTVIRYIFQNPKKAGIIKGSPENYKWCNYNDYLSNSYNKDISLVLNLFSDNEELAVSRFINFITQDNIDICSDIDENRTITDESARQLMFNLCDTNNISDFLKLHRVAQDVYLRQMKYKYNLPLRQIERLTGVSRSALEKL